MVIFLKIIRSCSVQIARASIFLLLIAFCPASLQCSTLKKTPKKWTVIVYIAADNDLRGFAARNIKQMATIGSNEHVNICVELHIRIAGNKKITRRYYIEENKILHVNANDPASQKMDSGDPKTLVSCCKYFMEEYPAEEYGLILWNHGTGVMDPMSGRIINATELFTFNPAINKLELDRSVGFLDLIDSLSPESRGICWDDSTGNYLNNQKLESALHEICTNNLQGRKLSILGFDACLMSMLEIADIVKNYAHIMVSSQEVELGTGWNYQQVFQGLQTGPLDRMNFARHIVSSYQKTYNKITNDYTLSALDLDRINELENNVSSVGSILLDCLRKQKNNTVRNTIKACCDKLTCTHFDEPTYKDLHHFYTNLHANLYLLKLHNDHEEKNLQSSLAHYLKDGCNLIKQIAFANTTGKNLVKAQGISIYLPDTRIHYSYRKTGFAAHNEWIAFLTQYLLV